MFNKPKRLRATRRQRERLRKIVRARSSPQKIVLRCRIVLLAIDGKSNSEIAKEVGCSRPTVILWRKRFKQGRVEALLTDKTRPGRNKRILEETVDRVIDKTLFEKPAGVTHWSTRLMARAAGISQSTVSRIWREHNLKPHRTGTFKLSSDPDFAAKVRDIVGLYLNPPDRALVLCVDEKSQIQALDRTQPLLPLGPGHIERRTHDYVRHGTTTLFAALDVKTGKVLGMLSERHRHEDYLRFLKQIDRSTPRNRELHLIVDNYGTHKHAAVRDWLRKHPRFHIHYTPTSGSWLNLVERWFGLLTQRCVRRGVFTSVNALKQAIIHYLQANNQNPRPFRWTKSATYILNKVQRCKEALDSGH
ncbi:MAG: IS630 family transposase [Candidatus Zixiibacteriota bacterium]